MMKKFSYQSTVTNDIEKYKSTVLLVPGYYLIHNQNLIIASSVYRFSFQYWKCASYKCAIIILYYYYYYYSTEKKLMKEKQRWWKKRSERCKHCVLAVVRQSQKFSLRHRPPSQGAGLPKFYQLDMVTTCTYRPSLVKIDARNFELSW